MCSAGVAEAFSITFLSFIVTSGNTVFKQFFAPTRRAVTIVIIKSHRQGSSVPATATAARLERLIKVTAGVEWLRLPSVLVLASFSFVFVFFSLLYMVFFSLVLLFVYLQALRIQKDNAQCIMLRFAIHGFFHTHTHVCTLGGKKIFIHER